MCTENLLDGDPTLSRSRSPNQKEVRKGSAGQDDQAIKEAGAQEIWLQTSGFKDGSGVHRRLTKLLREKQETWNFRNEGQRMQS